MRFNNTFEVDDNDDAVILLPLRDLGELENGRIDELYRKILQLFEVKNVKRLVIDLHHIDYFGSSALGFFVKLWQQIQERRGEMAFCNVSAHAESVFKATHLDSLWPLCESRTDALLTVDGNKHT